ncbi:hypothetical protein COL03_18860 [Bacillus thuringiensis]|nr:hypothetical protein COL03_18860 [Bacillus thuringiensis]
MVLKVISFIYPPKIISLMIILTITKKQAEDHLKDNPSPFHGAVNDFAINNGENEEMQLSLWQAVCSLAFKQDQISLEQIEKIVFINQGRQKVYLESINLLH